MTMVFGRSWKRPQGGQDLDLYVAAFPVKSIPYIVFQRGIDFQYCLSRPGEGVVP